MLTLGVPSLHPVPELEPSTRKTNVRPLSLKFLNIVYCSTGTVAVLVNVFSTVSVIVVPG